MRIAAFVLLVLPLLATAQSLGMESDWLELVKGHRDAKLGAEVMDVKTDPKTGHQMVMVSIPKKAMSNTPDMEEIVVTGKAPEKAEPMVLFPDMETEWIDDYDHDHYGLLVKLNSKQKIPFRLFLSSGNGFLDNAVDAVKP